MSKKNKRVKLQSKEEDRISYLPDSLVQHILSFLPSTKDAIHTTLLSKRWHNQWTRVPSSSSIPLRVKELKFGSQFIKILSALNLEGHLSPLLLNNKFLTLDRPNFEEHSGGIECALRIYHVLEKLVITLPFYKSQRTTNLPDLNGSGENYWNSNREVFDCLASHLKIIEINGLCESDDKCKYVLNFIEFLLKSVRVLEKLVVILKDGGKDFVIQVSKKLLDFPRCSQHATVKLLCSN
ncbi:F-box/FBD/LRR-repeat protein At2g04230-like isoform X4 [Euphorbia lathyris]|uniref:F-box/FBD/LRR-repeat protein At2g04230-like isoform X4 n=1 Tax=Euphorbia lathyris TaxID=212925 RepID=UPI003313B60E